MLLIVGLGNPGRRYAGTRHNVGFMVVDRLAARSGAAFSTTRCQSLLCRTSAGGSPVVLAKPQTFMNLSGRAVCGLLRHYRLEDSRLLVIYDDLALPLGRVRIRPSGGAGGQKGMESIIDAVGPDVARLRVGIACDPLPDDFTGYVLSRFRSGERMVLEEVLERAADAAEMVAGKGLEAAMACFNRKEAEN